MNIQSNVIYGYKVVLNPEQKKYYNEAYLYLPSLLSPAERDSSTKHEN